MTGKEILELEVETTTQVLDWTIMELVLEGHRLYNNAGKDLNGYRF